MSIARGPMILVSDQAKAWRLSKLGWTQKEIGELLGVPQSVVSEDIGNSHLGKIDNSLSDHWNDQSLADLAGRLELPITDQESSHQQPTRLSVMSGQTICRGAEQVVEAINRSDNQRVDSGLSGVCPGILPQA